MERDIYHCNKILNVINFKSNFNKQTLRLKCAVLELLLIFRKKYDRYNVFENVMYHENGERYKYAVFIARLIAYPTDVK